MLYSIEIWLFGAYHPISWHYIFANSLHTFGSPKKQSRFKRSLMNAYLKLDLRRPRRDGTYRIMIGIGNGTGI